MFAMLNMPIKTNNTIREKLRRMGLKIKSARFTRGVTQQQLEKKIGINPQRIRAIEKGEANTGIQTYLKIQQVLEIDDLFI